MGILPRFSQIGILPRFMKDGHPSRFFQRWASFHVFFRDEHPSTFFRDGHPSTFFQRWASFHVLFRDGHPSTFFLEIGILPRSFQRQASFHVLLEMDILPRSFRDGHPSTFFQKWASFHVLLEMDIIRRYFYSIAFLWESGMFNSQRYSEYPCLITSRMHEIFIILPEKIDFFLLWFSLRNYLKTFALEKVEETARI